MTTPTTTARRARGTSTTDARAADAASPADRKRKRAGVVIRARVTNHVAAIIARLAEDEERDAQDVARRLITAALIASGEPITKRGEPMAAPDAAPAA